jgi:hypothetical protein
MRLTLSPGVIASHLERGWTPPRDRAVFKILGTRALCAQKVRFAMTDGVDKYNHGMIIFRDSDKLPEKGYVINLGIKSRGASKNKMVIQDHRNILVVHNFTFVKNTVNSNASSDFSTQVRSSNLMRNKDWEADYYVPSNTKSRRPESLNAHSNPLMANRVAQLNHLDLDDGVGCIVITGSKRAFAAGANIKGMGVRSNKKEARAQDKEGAKEIKGSIFVTFKDKEDAETLMALETFKVGRGEAVRKWQEEYNADKALAKQTIYVKKFDNVKSTLEELSKRTCESVLNVQRRTYVDKKAKDKEPWPPPPEIRDSQVVPSGFTRCCCEQKHSRLHSPPVQIKTTQRRRVVDEPWDPPDGQPSV